MLHKEIIFPLYQQIIYYFPGSVFSLYFISNCIFYKSTAF